MKNCKLKQYLAFHYLDFFISVIMCFIYDFTVIEKRTKTTVVDHQCNLQVTTVNLMYHTLYI